MVKDSLQKPVHELPRNLPPVGDAQMNVLLVAAVEVTPSGLDQIIAVRESSVLLDLGRAVIAVDDLDAGKAQVDQIFKYMLELRIILGLKLNRMGQDRDPPCLPDSADGVARG